MPQTVLTETGILELSNMRLADPNYLAMRDYVNSKMIRQFVLEDNQTTDFQLKTILEGVAYYNFQHLLSFRYSKGDLGPMSIQVLCQIVTLQQMSGGQLA